MAALHHLSLQPPTRWCALSRVISGDPRPLLEQAAPHTSAYFSHARACRPQLRRQPSIALRAPLPPRNRPSVSFPLMLTAKSSPSSHIADQSATPFDPTTLKARKTMSIYMKDGLALTRPLVSYVRLTTRAASAATRPTLRIRLRPQRHLCPCRTA